MNKNQPRHVAIIMDGNGRWAQQRLLPRIAGHRAGLETAKTIIQAAIESGIPYLTLFAFSTENWRRPIQEVNALMDLFLYSLQKEVAHFHQNNIRLQFIGDLSSFNEKLQHAIQEAVEKTKKNTGLHLIVAANYGGRWDIVEAARKLALEVEAGRLQADDITIERFESQLSLSGIPDPDLLIRTGGEQRTSNFLNWQLAYTELYFSDEYWPSFNKDSFEKTLSFYRCRERRFGSTSEQVQANA